MNIRTKALIVHAAAYLAFVVILLLAAGGILVSDFERIEKVQVSREAERARNALNASLSRLGTLCKDYAAWDDAFAFASAGTGTFGETNFTGATFVNQHIGFVIIEDAAGRELYASAYDPGRGEIVAVPPRILQALRQEGLLSGVAGKSPAAGVVAYDGGFLMIASEPIVRSDASGPPAGICVMGRALGREELDKLSGITLLPLTAYPLDHPAMAGLLKDGPLVRDEPDVMVESPGRAEGLILVRDISGKPAFILGAGVDRLFFSMGLVSAKYFAGVVLFSVLGLMILTGFLMERLILRRLRAASRLAGRMARDKDLRSRLPVTGRDELTSLSREINALLENLRKADEQAAHTNEELRRARDAADQANRAKSEFLAKMNHEIRTPVNTILGMTDAALRAAPGDDVREFLEPAQEAAGQLWRIIDEVLDISRIEAGKLRLASEDFDVRALVESVARSAGLTAREKGLAIELELSPEVPRRARGDAGRLRQILINLVMNAVKFTDVGGVRIEVKRLASAEEPSGRTGLSFSVTDTGRGIARDKLDVIFETFVQGCESGDERRGGAGLGLSIAKELATLMGGEIKARSTPGEGSVFTFSAFFDPPGNARTNAEEAEMVRPSPLPGASSRLLLVEDNPANRKIVELYLKDEPFTIDVAENGKRAVEMAAANAYEAILMDMEMPVMDGYEATARIREGEAAKGLPPTPILALTAHAWTAQRERCFACGCTEFLSKPISRVKLRQVLYANLSRTGGAARPKPPEEGAAVSAGFGEAGGPSGAAPGASPPDEPASRASASPGLPPVLREPGPEDARFPEDPELRGLLPGLFDSVEKDLAAMRRELAGGDFASTAKRGRGLKSAGKSYGLPYVAEAGEMIEKAAEAGDARRAADLAAALGRYVDLMTAGAGRTAA